MTTTTAYEERHAGDLQTLLKELMDLRLKAFWSFRGQRNTKWALGVHGLPSEEALQARLIHFKRRCMEFPAQEHISEHDKWRWLFYAQHFRLKTRLLDWTSNPLVAIYFAVENILSRGDDEQDIGAVWALRVAPVNFQTPEVAGEPDDVTRWIMLNPPPVGIRLVRQSAKFSYHPPGNDAPISESPRRSGDERLIKFSLTNGHSNPCRAIREQLGIMNVHHASLFPGPEAVAAFVNHEWPVLVVDRQLPPDMVA